MVAIGDFDMILDYSIFIELLEGWRIIIDKA